PRTRPRRLRRGHPRRDRSRRRGAPRSCAADHASLPPRRARGGAGRHARPAGRLPQGGGDDAMSALGSAPAPDRPLRLGFVCLGWFRRTRMQALIDEGLAGPAVVLDSAPAATDSLHDLAPGAAIANSIEDLLTDDLDGVVIATPNALHAEQAVAALQRGLPVFCQKPLGRSAPEVRQVLKAARDADRLLGVDLSYRHAAGMRRIREL